MLQRGVHKLRLTGGAPEKAARSPGERGQGREEGVRGQAAPNFWGEELQTGGVPERKKL